MCITGKQKFKAVCASSVVLSVFVDVAEIVYEKNIVFDNVCTTGPFINIFQYDYREAYIILIFELI